ncbi:response regulator [Maridesulfovibrio sp.]|uniref:response regulator n=1 Tax=Maridesulfovibrio sp. TaxID=2795000 RepID=UPI0029CA5922|nr:response regulator [Maridesulfovibrio sp.]
MKVLVVEDDPTSQLLLKMLLEKMECEVIVTGNGYLAIEILSLNAIDLVFMDVNMPIMNGKEAAKRIRGGEAGVDNIQIPIIACTAHDLTEQKRIIDSGFNDIMIKPIEIIDVKRVLNSYR